MRSLIKGEIFKLRKEKFYLIIGFVVMIVLVGSVGLLFGEESGTSLFTVVLEKQMSIILYLYVGILFFLCFHLGSQFSSKRIHLEIMNGFTRKKVFFSKILILVPICLAINWILIIIFFIVVNIFIPVDMHVFLTMSALKIILMISFILIRFCVMMICMNFIFRQGILSGIAIWLYNVVQIFPIGLPENDFITEEQLNDFGQMFGWGQWMTIVSGTLTWSIVSRVLITGIVEMLFIGTISYLSFKKQELK